MPEKRPKWSRLKQGEIERQRAVVDDKLRTLRAALRSRERIVVPDAVEATVIRQLRQQIAGLEATAVSLQFRVSSARHAAARSRQRPGR